MEKRLFSDRPKGKLRKLKQENPEAYRRLKELERKQHISRADFLRIAAGMATASALSALTGRQYGLQEAYASATNPEIGPSTMTNEASYIIGIDGSIIYAINGRTEKRLSRHGCNNSHTECYSLSQV